MDLQVFTKHQLHQHAAAIVSERDERMVSRIVHQVYSQVLYSAARGLFHTKWFAELFKYEDTYEYQLRHIVNACSRVQRYFPDSRVYRPHPKQIVVDWS